MGGGGTYYDRDVTPTARRKSTGYSDTAQVALSRDRVNVAVLPKERFLATSCASPVVFAFDVTGSMGTLPKVIYDKVPMIAGQLVMQNYLPDPMLSLAAVGDVVGDQAPIQVADFAQVRALDQWLERLWLEGRGGSTHHESYEFMAYFYAYRYDMQQAHTPIFLFTGDEGFRERLSGRELSWHFGGQHDDVDATEVFRVLRAKFNGNVFLIHKRYSNRAFDKEIVHQWEDALGAEQVIYMDDDLAVADIILGVFALAGGMRTLDGYIEDIRTRPLQVGKETFKPQSESRIKSVRLSLESFAAMMKKKNQL